MPYNDEVRAINEAFINSVLEGHVKKAQQATDNFLRIRVREDGVARKILPPVPVTSEQFTPQVDTDQPVIVEEKEPASPGAVVMAFGDMNPPAFYLQGRKYKVVFYRISSPTVRKDEAELKTYRSDVRQLLAEMIVKDLSWAEDSEFIAACNTLMGGTAGASNIMNGLVHWRQISGGVSRISVGSAFKFTFDPPSRIPITRVLTNAATAHELWKFDRLEVGGDAAENIFFEGWGDRKLNGCDVIMSIKKELIPNDTFYMFGDNRFLGRFYVWQEPTIYIKREDVMIEFRAHEIIGMAIGHGDGVFRFDFVSS